MGISKKSKSKKQRQCINNHPTSIFGDIINFNVLTPQDNPTPTKQNFWTSEKMGLFLTVILFIFLFYNYVFCDIFTLLLEFYNSLFYDPLTGIVDLLYGTKSSNVFNSKDTSSLFNLVLKNPFSYPKQVLTCLSILEIFLN